ncbi:hypothetical protein Tco_0691998 [Tanacetum coccineum]
MTTLTLWISDELTIADFEGTGFKRLKMQYNNDVELEYHVSQLKAAVLSEAQWNSDEGDISKKDHLNDTLHKRSTLLLSLSILLRDTTKNEEDIIDFFKAGMSAVTKGNIFSDLRIKSVVRIYVKKKWGYGLLTLTVVRRFDDKEYEFSYANLP